MPASHSAPPGPADEIAVVAAIQSAALDPEHWHETLALLDRTLGGSTVALHFSFPAPGEPVRAFMHGYDPAKIVEWEEHLREVDPWVRDIQRGLLPEGKALFSLVPHEEFRASEFSADFLEPQELRPFDSVAVALDGSGPDMRAALGLTPKKGSPVRGADELAFIQRLVPHLRNGVALSRLVSGFEPSLDVLDTLTAGLALLDERGHVCAANRALRERAERRDGLRIERGRLEAEGARDRGSLARALADVLRPAEAIPSGATVRMGDERRPFVLHTFPVPRREAPPGWVGPFGAAAGVWVMDPSTGAPASADVLGAAFGLTPAEARTAAILAEGRAPADVADALAITRNTAREYTKRVLSKAGARRQPELVRRLISVLPPARLEGEDR